MHRWPEWRWPLGLMALTALFFGPAWLGWQLLYNGLDIRTIHYPLHAAYAQALRQGTLLLWTPHLAGGFPLFAEGQMGGLYPPNLLLYRLLPLNLAHNWSALLHLLGAQAAAWALARTLRIPPPAAALVGFVYGMSVVGSALGDFYIAFCLAWLPAVLTALLRGYETGRGGPFVAAGVCLGLQGLTFFPQGLLLTAVAASCLALSQVAGRPWRAALRPLAATVGAAALGAALSAVQWLPTLELKASSLRAAGLDAAFAGQGSLPPWALSTWWAPDLLAELGSAGYVGLLPLALAALALPAWRRDRRVSFALLLAALSLLLALGRYSPLFELVRRLPGLHLFRNSIRFTFLTRLALALLAGLGWQCLQGLPPQAARRWSRAVGAAGLLVTAALLVGGRLVGWLRPTLTDLATDYAQRLQGSAFHVQGADYFQARVQGVLQGVADALSPANGELWAALALALATAAWLRWGGRVRPAAWALLGVALAAADLLGHAGPLGFTEASAAQPGAPALLYLRSVLPPAGSGITPPCLLTEGPEPCGTPSPGRIYSLTDQPVEPGGALPYLLPENANLAYGIPSVGIYSSLGAPRRYDLLADLGAVNLAFGMAPTDQEVLSQRLPLLSRLGVRYVLALHPLQAEGGLRLAFDDGAHWIYENPAALPRVVVLPAAEVGLSAAEVLARLRDPAFDPWGPALLEEQPAESGAGYLGAEARILADDPHYLALETDGGGWLLLSDAFYPDWRVWVDGEPASLYRADYVSRAVPLGPGPHRVEFRYQPRSFWWGAATSGAAWTLTLGGLLALRLRANAPPRRRE
ncbi:MAG: YfhO family protein [Chloroflexi bacterium]|nr:YfhO family protein [Chloroflexota bacterium]